MTIIPDLAIFVKLKRSIPHLTQQCHEDKSKADKKVNVCSLYIGDLWQALIDCDQEECDGEDRGEAEAEPIRPLVIREPK